jgi:hypothetical protein
MVYVKIRYFYNHALRDYFLLLADSNPPATTHNNRNTPTTPNISTDRQIDNRGLPANHGLL